ncbi:aspartic proteinase nepenthesin-1-like [Fagus crenata]
MVASATFSAIILFCYLLALSHLKFTSSKPGGFTLELIHRDSPKSPLYPGNLTLIQRFKRLVQFSEAQVSYLNSLIDLQTQNPTFTPSTVRPKVVYQSNLYVINLSIGSKSVTNYLVLDTGSDFISTQCKTEKEFFDQTSEIYDPKTSTSFQKLPCNQCTYPNIECNSQPLCTFSVQYLNGAIANGVVSLENFGFDSQNGPVEQVNNLAFGCANNGLDVNFNGKISGIMGMDIGGLSFVNQLASQGVPKRFSHCFIKLANETKASTFLRFGNDIPKMVSIQTTSLVRHPLSARYAVKLVGISVVGCLMESGSALSFFVIKAYDKISGYMVQYFNKFGIRRFTGADLPTPVCFNLKNGFNKFPTMTYHFQGADLRVNQDNMFIILPERKTFCLAMRPSAFTIIGAYQLQDTRVIYDVAQKTISFGPENCARDAS